MSSPIAIPRRAASPARSEASDASSLNPWKYVPVHKRGASPSSSAPSSSPVASASWRTHTPANPQAAFNSTLRKAHSHKKSGSASDIHDASKRAPIPAPAHIPSPTTTHVALPFVYPIDALLALAHAPAPLSETQVARLRMIPVRVERGPRADKPATPRRRRVGRPRTNSVLAQTAAPNVPADVETRRARHAAPVPTVRVHTAHGSWGWNGSGNASPEHPHNLEASWRHTPVFAAVAA